MRQLAKIKQRGSSRRQYVCVSDDCDDPDDAREKGVPVLHIEIDGVVDVSVNDKNFYVACSGLAILDRDQAEKLRAAVDEFITTYDEMMG